MMTLSEANKRLANKNIWIYQEDGLFYWYTLFGLHDVEQKKEGPFSSVYIAFRSAIENLPYEEELEALGLLGMPSNTF